MVELYSFRDCVTGEYDRFFVARNQQDAMRIARVSMANNPFFSDLDLYFHAAIDQSTGDITPSSASFVCHLVDLLRGVKYGEEE